MRERRALAAIIVCIGVGGCSPALNWRQVRPTGWQLALMMPCRPVSQERRLMLAGMPLTLRLLACDADGNTYAVASAEVADPAAIAATLRALGEAARANLSASAEAELPAEVKGMTPQPAARRWQLRGVMPDGRPVREQLLVFAHGQRIFQAVVVGPRADDALARPCFDSIAIQP